MNRDIARLREAVVKVTQLLVGHGLLVTQEGVQAFVAVHPKTGKPVRINIPFIPDNAAPELVAAIAGFIDHEVAHTLFTDWRVVAKAGKAGIGAMHNLVEDTFIERAMGGRFPGSVWNVERLHDFFISGITAPLLAEAGADQSRRFGILLVPIARAWAGQKAFQDFMSAGGHWDEPIVKAFIDRLGPSVPPRMPNLTSSAECFEVAKLFQAATGQPPEQKGKAKRARANASAKTKETRMDQDQVTNELAKLQMTTFEQSPQESTELKMKEMMERRRKETLAREHRQFLMNHRRHLMQTTGPMALLRPGTILKPAERPMKLVLAAMPLERRRHLEEMMRGAIKELTPETPEASPESLAA